MTDDELHREAEVMARDLHARGFLVTIDFAVEPAAIADLIGLRSIDMLRRWRHELIGPPHRTHRRVVLYPLDEYLVWKRAAQEPRRR